MGILSKHLKQYYYYLFNKNIKLVQILAKNPMDFTSFIRDCCELSDEYKTPKSDLKLAHRIWSKSSTKETIRNLDEYLKNSFKSGVIIENDIKRNVYKGVKLKRLHYEPNGDNLCDFEQFILEKCNVSWSDRVSYTDFFTEFIDWKSKIQKEDYILTNEYKRKIQRYLEMKFAGGRVHLSNNSKTTHLFGVWGVGLKGNGGLKIPKRTCKSVEQYNQDTKVLVKSWESLSVASRELNIPISTLSNHCRFGTVINNCFYKYSE
jgi:hypothetical protein